MRSLISSERGVTAVEYGLLAFLISASIVGAVHFAGRQTDAAFCAATTAFGSTAGCSGSSGYTGPTAASLGVPAGVWGVSPLPGMAPVPPGTVCKNEPFGSPYNPTYYRVCTRPDGSIYSGSSAVSPIGETTLYPGKFVVRSGSATSGYYYSTTGMGYGTTADPVTSFEYMDSTAWSNGIASGSGSWFGPVSSDSQFATALTGSYSGVQTNLATGANTSGTFSSACTPAGSYGSLNPAAKYVLGIGPGDIPAADAAGTVAGGGVAKCQNVFTPG